MLCARAGAAAIAAAVALSPTYAAPPQPTDAASSKPAPAPRPKPVIDLSKSPALSGKTAPAAKPAAEATSPIGGLDEQTLAYGGGALALLALGAGAVAIARSRRERREAAAWEQAATAEEQHDPLFDEPMFHHEPPVAEATALDQPCDQPSDDGSDRCPGESWVERAHRGPSPANPSASLRHRLSRAAFFDKRERDVAAGKAAPIEPDAGLPEAMVEEQEREEA